MLDMVIKSNIYRKVMIKLIWKSLSIYLNDNKQYRYYNPIALFRMSSI